VEGAKGVLKLLKPECFSEYDALVFTETFAVSNFDILGFYGFHSLAVHSGGVGRPKGGISCLLKPWLLPAKIVLASAHYVVVAANNVNIIGAYFPPDCTSYDLCDDLTTCLVSVDLNLPTVLAGDFNCRLEHSERTHKTRDLILLLNHFSFHSRNDATLFTYVTGNGASVIDLIFCNLPVCDSNIPQYAKSLLPSIRKLFLSMVKVIVTHNIFLL